MTGRERAAALTVCAHATDPTDARHLLEILGLTTPDPSRPLRPDRCGSYAGYKAHTYRHEPICEPCRVARNTRNATYQRRRRKETAR